MVQINFAQKTVNVKIVFYGPGMSGKTTNLEVVHQRSPDNNRGELTSISTDGDRTLFFDYMPLDLGTVAGMRTCFQVYTVPGQVYYNSTRKLVLQGTDGVIFIADSAPSMMEQNLESLRNLEENLNEYGKSLATTPHVLQWNKRDLPDAVSVEEMARLMNAYDAPVFEAIANTGQGVFPTLKSLAQLVLKSIMQESNDGGAKPKPAAAAAPKAAPAPVAPAPAPQAAPAPQPGIYAPPEPDQVVPAAAEAPPAPNLYPVPTPTPVAAPAAATGLGLSPAAQQHAPPAVGGLGRSPAGAGRAVAAGREMGSSAGEVMRQPQGARAAQRTQSGAAKRAGSRVATQRPAVSPKPKRGLFATGMFIVLAAVLGAGLAGAVLHFMKQG